MPSDAPANPPLAPPVAVPLMLDHAQACPYLPGKQMRTRLFMTSSLPAELYHRFMDANFRRAGHVFYQPVCRGCQACRQIRVPVARFAPSKSQRRCRRRNADLAVTVAEPMVSDEKFELYRRYTVARHPEPGPGDRETFEAFLYGSAVKTIEACYRDATGRLVAVGICDLCPNALSSVYFYFDPEQGRRSLGTFGVLREIELAREMGLAHYYLGYWVAGSRTMQYKADFRPCEVLDEGGAWREMGDGR